MAHNSNSLVTETIGGTETVSPHIEIKGDKSEMS